MRDLPFFSVVVPTYRRPAPLADCLRALARVEYPRERFEVIVVDDGGGTPLGSLTEEFRQSLDVRLLVRENGGPSAARNYGVAQARGEFLAFTDDDCAPAPGWLRALAARLAEDPARLVGGRTLNAFPDNPHASTSQALIELAYEHHNSGPEGPRFFASNNFALSTELFRRAGGFDESFRYSEDRDFCDRWIGRDQRMAYEPQAVVYHTHRLTLGALWRQHFGYGRGAFCFYRARAARGAQGLRPDLNFYAKLLRRPLSQSRDARALALTALLVWSQTANTFGYFYEWARSMQEGRRDEG